MKGATLRQLQIFSAAAKHLSFARAAEELHLSQPAVSMQIRELEGIVELPLFERSGRTVRLTLSGEWLLVYAHRVIATVREAGDALAKLRGVEAGMLSIGMVSTAEYFLPRVLAKFRAAHPGVEMRLKVGQNREDLVSLLNAHEVDLAVMGRPPRELEARAEPFAPHPLAVIASPEHRLARCGGLSLKSLKSEEFIVREPGSGTRSTMERVFGDRCVRPPIVMEMSSNETIKQAVMANMGLAFVSLHTVALELAVGQLVVLDVGELPVVRSWHIVHIQAKTLSPAAEALRYFILENARALLARQFADLEPAMA